MDPISLALGAVGLGMQIFGGFAGASNAKEQAKVSQDEAIQEQGINNLKQKQMEIDANRQKLQQFRTAQQTAALATTRATNQGAQFGSGLQGGLAGITDQTLYNVQGVNQAVDIGRGINQFNNNISADKMKMASLGGEAATDQAITSLGGTLMKIGPTVGALGKGFGGFSFGNYSGTPGASNTGGLY
jgi:outer membrane murein-binding lipoprotein Lpp